jgi:hypothetical protein
MSQPTPQIDELPSATTGSDFKLITSNDEFEERAKSRIEREVAKRTAKFADYDQLKAHSAELAQLKSAHLTEGERQAERIRTLETELQNERHGNLRRDVAAAKGVPADRISGASREELEQSADELLAFVAERTAPPKPTRPAAGLKSGATGTDTRMDPMERAAAALRQWAGTK